MNQTTTHLDELEKYGHLYSDELREDVIQHYVQKFRDHGGRATDSPLGTKSWVGGTGGATTRLEKREILDQIAKNRTPSNLPRTR